jgi:Cys-tRNA(Pro) deacylase
VTAHAAACLGVDEHTIVKTLVMQTDARKPLIVLMHGDCEVSTRQLARTIGARSVEPCDVKTVQKHTGFVVGGVSPFGTRTQMPIYGEATIFALERIYINGGKRGFLVEIDPGDAHRVLKIEQVHVAITQ